MWYLLVMEVFANLCLGCVKSLVKSVLLLDGERYNKKCVAKRKVWIIIMQLTKRLRPSSVITFKNRIVLIVDLLDEQLLV